METRVKFERRKGFTGHCIPTVFPNQIVTWRFDSGCFIGSAHSKCSKQVFISFIIKLSCGSRNWVGEAKIY